MTGDIELEFILEIMVVMLVATAVPIILATPLFIFVPETHMFLHVISCIAIDISGWLHSIYILICSALSQIIIHLTTYIYTRATRKPQVCHDVKDCGNPAHKDDRQGSIAEDIATTPEDDSGPKIKNEYCAVSCFGEDKQLSDFGRGETFHLDPHPISDSGELDLDEPELEPVLDPDGKPALNHDGDKSDGNPPEADFSIGESLELDPDEVLDSDETNPTAAMLETCSAVDSCIEKEISNETSIPSRPENIELSVEADSGLGNSITSNPDQQLDSNGLDKDQQLIKQVNEQSRVNHDEIENLAKESEQAGKEEVFDLNTKSEVIPSEQVETLANLEFSQTKEDDFDFAVDEKGGILTLQFSLGMVIFTFPKNTVSKRTRLRIAAGKEKPDEDGMLTLVMPSLHIFKFSPAEHVPSSDPAHKLSPYKLMKFEKPIHIEAKLLVDCSVSEMELQVTQSSNSPNWQKVDGAEIKKNGDRISVEIDFFAGLRIVTEKKSMELFYVAYLKRPTGITDPDKHFLIVLIYSTRKHIRREAALALAPEANDVIIGRQVILVRTPCTLRGYVSVAQMNTDPEFCRLEIDSHRINVLRRMNFKIKKSEQRPIERNETFEVKFELQSGDVPLRTSTQEFYWNAPLPTRSISIGSIGSVGEFIVNVLAEGGTGIIVQSPSPYSIQRPESSRVIPNHAPPAIVGRSSEPLFGQYGSELSSDDTDYDEISDESEENWFTESMAVEFIQHLESLHLNVNSPLNITPPMHQSTPSQTSSTNM